MVSLSSTTSTNRTTSEEDSRKNVTAKDESSNVTAFPPWHSIAFIATMIGVSLWYLPPMSEIDKKATVETFTRSLFPQFLTPVQIGTIRLCFAAYVLYLSIVQVTGEDLIYYTTYLPSSKLKANTTIRIGGFKYASAFTVWSWYLLGFHFACSGAIPLWHRYFTLHRPVPSWFLRCALLSFEVSAPCAMLISAVVTYALWPQALKRGKVNTFKRPLSLRMHNINSAMVLVEAALLGGIPVVPSHCTLAPIWGGCFVIYAWSIRHRWTKTGEPHFLYFFLDTTLPGFLPTVFLSALLLVLLVFYILFCTGTDFLLTSSTEPMLAKNAVVMALVFRSVCRFRD